MGSTAAPASGVQDLVARVHDAYRAHRFIDAYNLCAPFWNPSTESSKFSIEELVLAGRLAARLGGLRLSRWLLMLAREREPLNPLVRYFTSHLRNPRVHLIDELRAFENEPDLGGDNDDLRASRFVSFAFRWGRLRDFSRAQDCIKRAHELDSESSWVLSCESSVFGMMDDWQAALRCAEHAVSVDPAAPYAVNALATSLLNLGRIDESAHRTLAAVGSTQSYQVAQTACWHQCALAETMDETARSMILPRARGLANRLDELAPLADRESKAMFARARLDIAELADDHVEMERWSAKVRSHFHRQVLANLKKNPGGQRIRLPFRRVIQKYVECVPTSIASALAATGVNISVAEMAAEITFGGTSEWAAADWLKQRGFHVRFFSATAEIAVRLIKAGIAFTITWDDDQSGHAVAIVGIDEAAGTLLVHDPQCFRSIEYLLSTFSSDYSPRGILGLAAVPVERANQLDSILPAEAAIAEAAQAHRRALAVSGPSAARLVVEEVSKHFPAHPGTRYLKAEQALAEGRAGEALTLLRDLLERFRDSAIVRASFLNACRALGNTALLRQTLGSIAETGSVPGLQSEQEWLRPHQRYICEYADLLRLSSDTRGHAQSLLYSTLRRNPMFALAWHTLADLYSGTEKNEHALLAYRLGSLLSESNEHFARAYADELRRNDRTDEARQWLERRTHKFGSSPSGVSTWVTLIDALEDWGRPDAALAACSTALKEHAGSPELLVFIVPFLARMGAWEAAERELHHLELSYNPSSFQQAASLFYSMRGETTQAVRAAESWVHEAPRSFFARNTLLDLLERSAGSAVTLERAATWMREQPANEQIEDAFCRYCEQTGWRKLRVLRGRLKRNRDDGWAWRESVFSALHRFEGADERRRSRLKPQILSWLSECDRTSSDAIGTLNAHALWKENNSDWHGAVESYVRSIRRDPSQFWPYQKAWQCSCRFEAHERQRIWDEIHPLLLQAPGHLSNAREITPLLVERFGIREVEKIVEFWRQQRPDDPDILEAQADLLLDHGHGRSDDERALELLKPAVERYPYNTGLRMSLAGAYRALGNHGAAIGAFREIVRRHPNNTEAMIRLAWALYRDGSFSEYEEILSRAAGRDPRNPQVYIARAEILIDRNQLSEARGVVHEGLARLEWNVHMRERAIALLGKCGCYEEAISAARQGIVVYPRGAYLWFLLANALMDMPQFAEKGEIESCLRRSLKLNCTLFQAADLLAAHLAEQRRFTEAIDVIAAIEPRLCDPSPARGRLASIKRKEGKKNEAIEEMTAAVAAAPGYAWGWNSLSEWLEEDQNWNNARERLGAVPPQMLTNIQFRHQRLRVLEKAGTNVQTLDDEWDLLLSDFPDDVFLHLRRYDSLLESKRSNKGAVILEKILPLAPTNPFVLARLVEVRSDQNRSEDALEAALRVCFAPVEESFWPVNKAWDSLRRFESAFWYRMMRRIEGGEKPTLRAFARFSDYALKHHDQKRANQGLVRNWLPREGARELQHLLKTHVVAWADDRYFAEIFGLLTSFGYQRLVLRNWKVMARKGVEPSTALWAEVGRAMLGANKREGRRFLQDWRTRAGVTMWMVANYTLCLSRFQKGQLQEIVASCRDALNGLGHDHCARYLAYMEAEASALLGDQKALLLLWEQQAGYFDGKLKGAEYFRAQDKHLLGEIPMLVRFLQQGQFWLYRKTLWAMRLQRLRRPQWFKSQDRNLVRWFLIIAFWIVFMVIQNILQNK